MVVCGVIASAAAGGLALSERVVADAVYATGWTGTAVGGSAVSVINTAIPWTCEERGLAAWIGEDDSGSRDVRGAPARGRSVPPRGRGSRVTSARRVTEDESRTGRPSLRRHTEREQGEASPEPARAAWVDGEPRRDATEGRPFFVPTNLRPATDAETG